MTKRKWFKAEILSLGEWRQYVGRRIEDALHRAIAEFGEDDIGRVIEVR
jgi:hypothetical protein